MCMCCLSFIRFIYYCNYYFSYWVATLLNGNFSILKGFFGVVYKEIFFPNAETVFPHYTTIVDFGHKRLSYRTGNTTSVLLEPSSLPLTLQNINWKEKALLNNMHSVNYLVSSWGH